MVNRDIIDFGSVPIGLTAEQVFWVENDCGSPGRRAAVPVSFQPSDPNADFGWNGVPWGGEIQHQAEPMFGSVTFPAVEEGYFEASLLVVGNEGQSAEVWVVARGVAADLVLEVEAPEPLLLGCSVELAGTLRNEGTGSAPVEAVDVWNGKDVELRVGTEEPAPWTLLPGQSIPFVAAWTPTAEGRLQAELRVRSPAWVGPVEPATLLSHARWGPDETETFVYEAASDGGPSAVRLAEPFVPESVSVEVDGEPLLDGWLPDAEKQIVLLDPIVDLTLGEPFDVTYVPIPESCR